MNSTEFWTMLTAIGTIGSVVVALTIAIASGWQSRLERNMRIEADNARRARVFRSQAEQTAAWFELTDTHSDNLANENWTAKILNVSNQPVWDVRLQHKYFPYDSSVTGQPSEGVVPIVPPHQTVQIPIGNRVLEAQNNGEANTQDAVLPFTFRDNSGQLWSRHGQVLNTISEADLIRLNAIRIPARDDSE